MARSVTEIELCSALWRRELHAGNVEHYRRYGMDTQADIEARRMQEADERIAGLRAKLKQETGHADTR